MAAAAGLEDRGVSSREALRERRRPPGRCQGAFVGSFVQAQWKLSPQAQDPVAFGLSMVKPCFSMVSTKSMVAPVR